MRRSALVALAAVPLLAASAGAKPPARATVCGANGCAAFSPSLQWAGSAWLHRYVAPAPYFRIAVRLPPNVGVEGAAGTILYVPGDELWRVRFNGVRVWFDVPAGDLASLHRAVRGLRPFRAPARWPG
jgi:hypothetical protein